jgi:hypothetical protein
LRAAILKPMWLNVDALNGVIRLAALKKTRPLPAYFGGDKRPLGELSLLGKFIEVPEYLLFRRLHPESSSRNNPNSSGYDRRSVAWMSRFYKGSSFGVYMPTWTLLRDHLQTLWRSSLPFGQKMRLMSAFGRVYYWNRGLFAGELRNFPSALWALRAAKTD